MVNQIYSRQNCLDPAKLKSLIRMINQTQRSTLPTDMKGDIYESLVETIPVHPGVSSRTGASKNAKENHISRKH